MSGSPGAAPAPELVLPEASTARSSVAVAASFLVSSLLGGLLALLIAVILGEGPDTDAFLAAYSVYLVFTLFGSTLRVALVPLFGSTADSGAFRARAIDSLARLFAVAAAGTLVVAALSPLIGPLLVPGAPGDAHDTARASLAILSVASLCQIAAAGMSATLNASRRFVASAALFVMGTAATLVLATGLMAVLDHVGAAIGVLGGSVALLAGHVAYLRRFRFAALPSFPSLADGETWRLTARAASGAAVPIALQLNLTIALAAVSGTVGAVTAYSYSYFLAVLISSVTAATIGLVTMPTLVADLERRGREASDDYLDTAGPFSVLTYVPLAASYAVFGKPILDALLEGPLSPGTVEVLWDASRLFLLMGLAWAILAPLTTLALSLGLYRGLALVAAAMVPLQAALVIPASSVGPVTAAAAHAVAGVVLVVLVLVLVFRRRAATALLRAVRAGAPAAAFGLVFPALGLLGLADGSALVAAAGLTAGLGLYALLAYGLWPSVGRRAVELLLARG